MIAPNKRLSCVANVGSAFISGRLFVADDAKFTDEKIFRVTQH